MQAFSLYPPNIHLLSDNVIGAVTQRSRSCSSQLVSGFNGESRGGIAPELADLHLTMAPATFAGSGQSEMLERNPQTMEAGPRSLVTQAQQTKIKKTLNPPSRCRSSKTVANIAKKDMQASLAEEKKKRNQERCRRNQMRYRNKRHALRANLEIIIRQLHDEIKMLELRRQDVESKFNCWSVVVEYFRIFRYGFVMPTEEEHAFVLAFLRLETAPNVKDGDICGADALVGYWKIFSLTFDDVQFELERMEKGGGSSLIATTTTTVTISNNTLQTLFPHLTSDKTVGTKGKVLAAKLLGQRLVMHGSVHFDWDDMNSQVVNMHTQSDLLTPLLHLLGNLEDVSCVFKNAFVTPDCRLISGK